MVFASNWFQPFEASFLRKTIQQELQLLFDVEKQTCICATLLGVRSFYVFMQTTSEENFGPPNYFLKFNV